VHLLYLGDAGSIADSAQRYFVLAGVAVFERTTHWIEQELDSIAERFAPSGTLRALRAKSSQAKKKEPCVGQGSRSLA
jgi:hypothetical protein